MASLYQTYLCIAQHCKLSGVSLSPLVARLASVGVEVTTVMFDIASLEPMRDMALICFAMDMSVLCGM